MELVISEMKLNQCSQDKGEQADNAATWLWSAGGDNVSSQTKDNNLKDVMSLLKDDMC